MISGIDICCCTGHPCSPDREKCLPAVKKGTGSRWSIIRTAQAHMAGGDGPI